MNLQGICEYINQKHPVRFNRAQKDEFSVYLSRLFEHCGYAENEVKIVKMRDTVENNNIIVGDIENAEYIITCHYDTPGKTGFLFSASRYIGKVLCCVALVLVFLILALGFVIGLINIVDDIEYMQKFGLCLAWTVLLAVCFIIIPALVANKNNANTSSGLYTVLPMIEKAAKDPELKQKAAFIIFDNTEWGTLGSSAFIKWCKKRKINLDDKKVISLEYLGNGENLALCATDKKHIECSAFTDLTNYFEQNGTEFAKLVSNTFFVSDNIQFKNSVLLTKLNRSKLKYFYIPYLATKKDTVCDLSQLEAIGNDICDMILK